ncbi:MAG: BON domain-containing protein [Microcoleus sp. PH2017_15_JOR_U_A]|jgi:hyperosmotically inducible periplasmic protein|uniref:BON domain-containing protein n=1 Tax=unclassified Microcoleus TaxID=2642155 RepID=UPI001DC7B934|nr:MULTISPECIES: BON domain-containing protein [unclassified Microcoleus]MCC3466488.1 BON domain-containing protein [Microcoleus sp. PH2017_06_SFM_O_A]TAE16319.1 MAG: BON domain-containing protein [Oscillatoriales cyanobacterium]MCC3446489.1 BON domain-containing protein [Microcoleus sp. PH2017_09_SFU_O_A]MCC3454360.1 BON domain-containing protein [Microcoleus sp. PH2017_08_TRC_O_A]MCC3490078.1 BON domain-containing protein [Microcoleus sp. PH2017_16_JOR_D_A]
MNKLTPILISGLLLFGAAACTEGAKTSADAPNSTTENVKSPPPAENVQKTQSDATSDVRKAQANSDIRAREQRNNVTGGDASRADGDLKSEVRSKLEVNITKGALTVEAKDGAVTVGGTVPNQTDLAKIEPLAKEIKGVKSVNVTAVVAPAAPAASPTK